MPKSPIMRVFDCHLCWVDQSGSRRYLVLRRAAGKIYAGDWRMLGGKIKTVASLQGIEQEKAWQAALRETKEETGLVPAELYTVPYLNQFYEWQHDRINAIPVFVSVVQQADEPEIVLDDEHTEFRWITASDADQFLPWPAQVEGLLAAEKLLSSDSSLREHLRIQF